MGIIFWHWAPSMRGLSWLGVESMTILPSAETPIHAQPEPKRFAAAAENAWAEAVSEHSRLGGSSV